MLTTSSLWMRRIDQFEDSNEGKFTTTDGSIISSVQHSPYNPSQRDPFDGLFYVHCWTIGECISKSFWQHYAPNPGDIAIKSNINKLQTALYADKEKGILISPIRYIDRDTDSTFARPYEIINLIERCFTKGKTFCWENEMRLLYIGEQRHNESPELCIPTQVDLISLIDEIYINPTSNKMCESILYDLLKSYGLHNKQIIRQCEFEEL